MLKQLQRYTCTSKTSLSFEPACLFLSRSNQAAWSPERKLWVTLSNGKPPVHPFVFSEKSVVPGKLFFG